MNNIRKKLWDINLVVEEIKAFPQTYKTVLQELYNDGTCQTILRRKLNKLFKAGTICKSSIPGTRFGQAIFYAIPKKYHILIESDRISACKVYCFFTYEKMSRYYIKVKECWVLKKSKWEKIKKEKTFFDGNTLKWI